LVLGDSVIWGQYVSSEHTLSHYLNEAANEDRFANMGVNGMRPAALAGLVEYYGRPLVSRNVLLHCNLLWMSSPRQDLQETKQFTFDHPRLVPQFYPRIPCYHENVSARIGVVVGRQVPLFGWADHLRIAYFQSKDLPHWTLVHPYADPAAAVTLQLPSPDEPQENPPLAISWTEKPQMRPSSTKRLNLDTSFQWRSFQRTVEILRSRGNRVFVLVGPLNEHMLKGEASLTYHQQKRDVKTWLEAEGIPYYIPDALPRRLYADESHPLAEGYQVLAEQLFRHGSFQAFDQAAR